MADDVPLDSQASRKTYIQRFTLQDLRVRWNALREPNITADDGVMPDGDTPEEGGVGVDRNVIFDDGMPRKQLRPANVA